MSRFSGGGRWAASGWVMWVATLLVLGGCSREVPTDPAPTPPGGPELKSESVPFHDHGVDLSFSGMITCDAVGIDIQAEFDYHIIADVAFFPNREVFRLFFRDVELIHRNLETGSTVVQTRGNIEISDSDDGTFTTIEHFRVRGPDGKILLVFAGRLVFADGNLIFEAGQHPGFQPDFLTFICTALS
jgi:hypothetical protein